MKKLMLLILLLSSSAQALPNPAATNCVNKGYQYLLVQSTGICIFPDKSYCEEWAYFRGTCKPGQNFLIPKESKNPS